MQYMENQKAKLAAGKRTWRRTRHTDIEAFHIHRQKKNRHALLRASRKLRRRPATPDSVGCVQHKMVQQKPLLEAHGGEQ